MSTDHPFTNPGQPQQPAASNNTMAIVVIVLAVVMIMGLVCAGVLAALLLPAVSAARDAARHAQLSNQMKQIGIAIHNYHDTYRQFPPAVATNWEGTQTHGWRVTLLPYIEQYPLYEQWNENEAWDSAANSQLHSPMPSTYASPFDSEPDTTQSHFVAVSHPNGIMSGESGIGFANVSDGLSNTILAVYLPNRTVKWAEPSDVSLQELQSALGTASISDSVILLMADLSVVRITAPMDPATVEALVTRSGNETVSL